MSAEWTKYYQPGSPAEIVLPTDPVCEILETAVAEAKDKVALQFFGRTTTYTELGEQVNRAAEGLRRLGVKAGDRVALVLPNCPQHVVAFYAVLRLGAIAVEHNPLYTPRELRHMFEDHAARVVICWDAAVEKLRGQPRDIEVEHIVSVSLLKAMPGYMNFALHLPIPKLKALKDKLSGPARDTISWEKLLEAPPLDPTHPYPDVHDPAMLLYTSGTTSLPKGALLSHYNLYANARQGEAWMIEAETGKENLYAILPMFHAFGMTLYLTFGILKQTRMILFPTFDADMVLKEAKKYPPNIYCAVPPIYQKTAERAEELGISLKEAKFCISGAMNLPDATVEKWESMSGGLLVEGYGMTEASPICTGNPFYPTRRTGTIGIPFPSTNMKVVDPDDPTVEVAQGERGELLIQGPQVFMGYWNNPDETERTLLPGGWLRTGDLVEVDADGFVTLVDRVKELIITGGFNVSPSEVEAVLRSHPDVADVAVVGIPLAKGGEKVVAAVVSKEGAPFNSEELRSYSRTRLAAYKVPKVVVQIPELPKNMMGKVLRKEVREKLIERGV
ncbi:MAG: AMP-binding protein [Propionibacteriaceae bacterium]|jgi:long-chain acyl-CoA synthetase|nr:AMP-binding protein [Propionibacteriaceae bacterium]